MRLHMLVPKAFLELRNSKGRSQVLQAIMANPATSEDMIRQHASVHWAKTVKFLSASSNMPRMSLTVRYRERTDLRPVNVGKLDECKRLNIIPDRSLRFARIV